MSVMANSDMIYSLYFLLIIVHIFTSAFSTAAAIHADSIPSVVAASVVVVGASVVVVVAAKNTTTTHHL